MKRCFTRLSDDLNQLKKGFLATLCKEHIWLSHFGFSQLLDQRLAMICLAYLLLSSCAACVMNSHADANFNTMNFTESESIIYSNSVAVCDMINTTSFNYYTDGGLLVCNYGGLPIQEDPNATLPSPFSRVGDLWLSGSSAFGGRPRGK